MTQEFVQVTFIAEVAEDGPKHGLGVFSALGDGPKSMEELKKGAESEKQKASEAKSSASSDSKKKSDKKKSSDA